MIHAELFGYEKGAFAGAQHRKIGQFELAQGGTLFLDRVGELTKEEQANLLRFLEEKTITRIGSIEKIVIGARIIAADGDLKALVREGKFRKRSLLSSKSATTQNTPVTDKNMRYKAVSAAFFQQIRYAEKKVLCLLRHHSWLGNPGSQRLLITADGGGSNGSRVRLWKRELQALATELGVAITVCHYPPGTSKWNKIEHRLFSFITMNWRGRPLVSHEVVVNLIASTTTRKGLQVYCELDSNEYPKGIKVTDAEMDTIKIDRNLFHGEWNYTISP